MPLEVVRAHKDFRMTDRVLFVVDTSGSMTGELDLAIRSVNLIVQTPMDGFQVGLITFTDKAIRWVGNPHCDHIDGPHGKHCVMPRWAAMPNDYLKFHKYLTTCSADGGTDACLAMSYAMNDTTERLTIVLVTDGDFSHTDLIKTIQRGRRLRAKQKLDDVHIMVWGVGSKAKELADVAKVGGGGLWVHGKRRSGPW